MQDRHSKRAFIACLGLFWLILGEAERVVGWMSGATGEDTEKAINRVSEIFDGLPLIGDPVAQTIMTTGGLILVSVSAVLWLSKPIPQDALLETMQGDDPRLSPIRKSINGYVKKLRKIKKQKKDMKELAEQIIEYISTCLSPQHAIRIQAITQPLFEKGTANYQSISQQSQSHLSAMVTKVTADDILPWDYGTVMDEGATEPPENKGTSRTKIQTRQVDLTELPCPPKWQYDREHLTVTQIDGFKENRCLKTHGNFDYPFNYFLSHPRGNIKQVKFVAKYQAAKNVIYVRVGITTQDDVWTTGAWLAIFEGTKKPERVSSSLLHEWAIYLPFKQLGDDWFEVTIDIPQFASATFPQDGCQYRAVTGFRFRGNMSIGAIEYDELQG